MNGPHPRVGYDQGWEAGCVVPVVWHTSYGTPVQLCAGDTRADIQRLALLQLIRDFMVPETERGAAKRKRQSGEAPARSKHNTHDGRNPVS